MKALNEYDASKVDEKQSRCGYCGRFLGKDPRAFWEHREHDCPARDGPCPLCGKHYHKDEGCPVTLKRWIKIWRGK